MNIPSAIALPQEFRIDQVDYSLPPAARSIPMKIMPTNVSTVTSGTLTSITGANTSYVGDQAFPSQSIIFDLPAGMSPSMFIDNRFTTLNFRALITQVQVSAAATTNTNIRGSAYSFFDRQYINGQNGIIEDITELGLVADNLLNYNMNWAQKIGMSTMLGLETEAQDVGLTGRTIQSMTGRTPAAGDTESMSFSIPVISSLIGVTANKMFNIGRTSKLQLVFNTASILPITQYVAATNITGTFTFALTDFFLNLECIDIGSQALASIDAGLVNGLSYVTGQTYRTSSVTISAGATGPQSLIVGLRGSSVKSLFVRFQEGGATAGDATTVVQRNSANGKYDSKLPNINSICFNVQGTGRLPNVPVNPLLNPANSMREVQMAFGNFYSNTQTTSVLPSQYCKLCDSANRAAIGVVSYVLGGTQDINWNYQSNVGFQCAYLFGVNTEIISRRGLFSGLNCLTSPIFLEVNVATANTNTVTAYVTALLDSIYIHNVIDGSIIVRV
jgi:hypothetical protein